MQSPWTSSSCSAWKSCISIGDEVYLCAHVTDIADGATATIKIVEKDADGKDDPVATLSAVVSGGRIKCKWQVKYTADEDDADSQQELAERGYTLPEYAFVVECGGAESGESVVLEVRGWIRTQFKDKYTGQLLSNRKYIIYLFDGSTIKGITDENGYIEVKDLKFGQYIICL